MKSVVVISLLASALCALACCDRRPGPKFRIGDRVRVKLTREEGRVSLWTRFFRQDHYFVRLAGSDDVRLPVGVRDLEFDAAFSAKYGLSWISPNTATRTSHDEGPFYDSELERVR